jgi:hypothetical protein
MASVAGFTSTTRVSSGWQAGRQPHRDERRLTALRPDALHCQLTEAACRSGVDSAADPEHVRRRSGPPEPVGQELDPLLDLVVDVERRGYTELRDDQFLQVTALGVHRSP